MGYTTDMQLNFEKVDSDIIEFVFVTYRHRCTFAIVQDIVCKLPRIGVGVFWNLLMCFFRVLFFYIVPGICLSSSSNSPRVLGA